MVPGQFHLGRIVSVKSSMTVLARQAVHREYNRRLVNKID